MYKSVVSCNTIYQDIEDAEDEFVVSKEKLLDVNKWSDYGFIISTSFSLSDHHHKPLSRHARKGDHIKITTTEESAGPAAIFQGIIAAIEYDDYPDDGMEIFSLHISDAKAIVADEEDAPRNELVIGIKRAGGMLTADCHGIGSIADTECGDFFGFPAGQWHDLLVGFIK